MAAVARSETVITVEKFNGKTRYFVLPDSKGKTRRRLQLDKRHSVIIGHHEGVIQGTHVITENGIPLRLEDAEQILRAPKISPARGTNVFTTHLGRSDLTRYYRDGKETSGFAFLRDLSPMAVAERPTRTTKGNQTIAITVSRVPAGHRA